MNNILGFTKEELEEKFKGWHEPSYRALQILDWIYKKFILDPLQMTNLPKVLRDKLKKEFSFNIPKVLKKIVSGNTVKYLLDLEDGEKIETVLISHKNRKTVCLSVQVGCPFKCRFCATGLIGFRRNLEVHEIIGQLFVVQKDLLESGDRVSNVVFMGMGEPLANYERVIKSIKIIKEKWGLAIGSKHITLSTIGIVPKIYELAEEPSKIRLAISLHAPNNEIRNMLIPINKEYPLEELLDSVFYYAEKTGRRVTFEYVLIKNLNDRLEHSKELGNLLKGKLVHVNLIPWNKVPEYPWETSNLKDIILFKKTLEKMGINVTLRVSYGSKIKAGCGQLRAVYLKNKGELM
ncbi:MAG: 23S rRNA (adenine(2503)-C(2))-methyltransferase RlmN [Dictyoglomus sp.]